MIIVLEGIDGCGKSTLARELSVQLTPSRVFHFPTELTTAGKMIKRYLDRELSLEKHQLLQLFLLDMKDAMRKYSIGQNEIAILDRYYFSTIVYQTILSGISEDEVRTFISGVKIPEPSITFYVRVPLAVARERISSRSKAHDAFDSDGTLLSRVYHEYERLWNNGEMIAVDGTLTPDEVISQCIDILEEKNLWQQKRSNQ